MSDTVSQIGRIGTFAVAGTFILLMTLEAVFPLRARKRPRLQRAFVNIALTGFVFVAGSFVVRRYGLGVAAWTASAPFGLLHIARLPFWAQLGLGFLLMDLTFYWWHRANHEVPLLWRFHNVHHADPDLDVTTSFRFHFVEVLYSTGFRVAQVALIGVSPLIYAVYELAFSCATVFHHSNMKIPLGLERAVNSIFVTPRMHGIHHDAVKADTNSNYSVIFRWWDALHGSLRRGVKTSEINIGVPAYMDEADNGLVSLIAMPFRRQREYWRGRETREVKDNSHLQE